jgi:hypothetical protein
MKENVLLLLTKLIVDITLSNGGKNDLEALPLPTNNFIHPSDFDLERCDTC